MSAFLGDWVKAIMGAALVCSAAISLTPKGKVKNVLKLTCGLVLVCVMAGPLVNPTGELAAMSIAEYRQKADEITAGATTEVNSLNRTLIEEELSAYISDKAVDMGESLNSVSVNMTWSSEGFWYPTQISITGAVSEACKKRLTGIIEGELGVLAENQHWSEYEN